MNFFPSPPILTMIHLCIMLYTYWMPLPSPNIVINYWIRIYDDRSSRELMPLCLAIKDPPSFLCPRRLSSSPGREGTFQTPTSAAQSKSLKFRLLLWTLPSSADLASESQKESSLQAGSSDPIPFPRMKTLPIRANRPDSAKSRRLRSKKSKDVLLLYALLS